MEAPTGGVPQGLQQQYVPRRANILCRNRPKLIVANAPVNIVETPAPSVPPNPRPGSSLKRKSKPSNDEYTVQTERPKLDIQQYIRETSSSSSFIPPQNSWTNHSFPPVKCAECNRRCRDSFDEAWHIAAVHHESYVYECVRCFTISSTLYEADAHLQSRHGLRVPMLDENEKSWAWKVYQVVTKQLKSNDDIDTLTNCPAQAAILQKYRKKAVSRDTIIRNVYINGPYVAAVKVTKADAVEPKPVQATFYRTTPEQDLKFIESKFGRLDLFKFLNFSPDLLAMASNVNISLFAVLYAMHQRGLLKIYRNGRLEPINPSDPEHEDTVGFDYSDHQHDDNVPLLTSLYDTVEEFTTMLKKLPQYIPPPKINQRPIFTIQKHPVINRVRMDARNNVPPIPSYMKHRISPPSPIKLNIPGRVPVRPRNGAGPIRQLRVANNTTTTMRHGPLVYQRKDQAMPQNAEAGRGKDAQFHQQCS